MRGNKITEERYKLIKALSEKYSLEEAANLAKCGVETARKVRKSESYDDYKTIVRKDNGTWNPKPQQQVSMLDQLHLPQKETALDRLELPLRNFLKSAETRMEKMEIRQQAMAEVLVNIAESLGVDINKED